MDKIVATRGAESVYRDAPPKARREKNRPTKSEPVAKHGKLLAEFKALSRKQRLAQAGRFHIRLERVIVSPDKRQKIWRNDFEPLLAKQQAPALLDRLPPAKRAKGANSPPRLRQTSSETKRGRKPKPSP
jgi:hypothetical protein